MPRRGLDALVLPGKFLVDKLTGLKKQQQEQSRRKVTERELAHLHHKIMFQQDESKQQHTSEMNDLNDSFLTHVELKNNKYDKLLVRLEEHEPEQALTQDEECAICISAKATMQTFPCGHRVVCRKCFVKTIQMAVSQRLLPLRCVICRAKILRLKQLTPSNRAFGTSSSSNSHQYQQQEFSSAIFPAPYANKLPEAGDVCQRARKPHFGHPYANASSVSRANFRQRFAAARSPALLPIPETEELELVNTVQEQEQVLCPDFGNSDDEWSEKDDLKAELKAKDPLEKMDHYHVVRWFSKFKRFKPPSILKGIRNRWKK